MSSVQAFISDLSRFPWRPRGSRLHPWGLSSPPAPRAPRGPLSLLTCAVVSGTQALFFLDTFFYYFLCILFSGKFIIQILNFLDYSFNFLSFFPSYLYLCIILLSQNVLDFPASALNFLLRPWWCWYSLGLSAPGSWRPCLGDRAWEMAHTDLVFRYGSGKFVWFDLIVR